MGSTLHTGHPARSRAGVVVFLLAALVAGLAASIVNAPTASASHYRATQITWHRTGPTEAEFHLTASWRCTFFFSSPCSAQVGDTFFADGINYGDGSGENPQWEVTFVDQANDVISAEAHTHHTYASTGPFTAFLTSCCRLGGRHINNPHDSVRVETIVDLAATSHSAESQVAPMVDCPLNGLCQFTVPAIDGDNQGIRFRFSTSLEASGTSSFEQPGPPHAPNAATIDPVTGLYSWDTTGAQLASGTGDSFYSTQVMVENVVGGQVVSKTAVDFFIRLTTNPNLSPTFIAPTPADGTRIDGYVGSPITFDVAAEDPDAADTVTLNVIGLPSGASFTTSPGNPASGTFTWTPSAAGSHIITLTAQDQHGRGAIPRSITFDIASAAPTEMHAHPVIASADTSDPSAEVQLHLGATLLEEGSGTAGSGKTVGLDLSPEEATGTPVAGRTVVFSVGDTEVCTAVTDATGEAQCGGVAGALQAIQAGSYTAQFAGDGTYLPSSASGSLLVIDGDAVL